MRVSPSGQPEFLSMVSSHPGGDSTDGLMAALRGALFEPMIPDAPRPALVLLANASDKNRIELAGGAYGLNLQTDPNIAPMIQELGEMFNQMQTGGMPEVTMMAPVPDGVTITEEFATSYLAAARALWNEAPWKGLENADLFSFTWPDGMERVACVMGQGGQEFGMLFFNTIDDFNAFNMASMAGMINELKTMMDGGGDIASQRQLNELLASLPEGMDKMLEDTLANPPDMPEVLGLNYNPPAEAPPAMKDYLNMLGADWLKEKMWPFAIKYAASSIQEAEFEMMEIEPVEFAMIRDAALALVNVKRGLKKWPPADGYSTTVKAGAAADAPEVKVLFIASNEP